MYGELFATTTVPVEYLSHTKTAATLAALTILWVWETWLPFFERPRDRLRHGGRNLAVAVINTVVLAAAFNYGIMAVADWTEQNHLGLLHAVTLDDAVLLVLALILLDAWMYV